MNFPPKYVDEGFPLITSKNLKDGEIDFENVQYISQKDYDSISKRSFVKKNDVLLAMIGTIGNPVVVKTDIQFAIKNVALFKTNETQSPDFLKYFLMSPLVQAQMLNDAKGATQKFVGLGYLRNFMIPNPPLSVQQKIVEKLDAIFSEIDKASASAEANIQNADALFQSYLTSILEDCKNKYPDVILSSVCEFDKKQGMYKNLPYIGMEHIESWTSKFLGDNQIATVASSTFYFSEEHVLYGRLRPYLNKVLLPNFKGHCSTEIFPLKVKSGLSREFLKFWIMSPKINYQINQTCTGARMPRANMNEVLHFKLNIPPMVKQHELVDELMRQQAHCSSLKDIYVSKVKQLNFLRTSVLSDAFKVPN